MAKTVYWAPWANPEIYSKHFLSFQDPVRVLEDIKSNKNTENKLDNFLNCPAFVNSVKNTYMFTAPSDADIGFDFNKNVMYSNIGQDRPYDHNTVTAKPPSMSGAMTVRYFANWVFFCEEPLHVHSTPAYMHKSPVTDHGYYVPGTFDISSWFRPIEYAFQLWPGHDRFAVEQDDPLLYINFLTDEPVKLQKFYLTPEAFNIGMSCVSLKTYRREKNLFKLYDIFRASKLRSKLLKEIKNNLL